MERRLMKFNDNEFNNYGNVVNGMTVKFNDNEFNNNGIVVNGDDNESQ